MSREAVLLEWERKIEAAERRDGERRFVRAAESDAEGEERGSHARDPEVDGAAEHLAAARFDAEHPADEQAAAEPLAQVYAEPVQLHPVGAATRPEPRRFERSEPVAERRTITIKGQPTPARRRRAVLDSQLAQPDRIALWAFLLGLLLVAVAAGTAHA